MLYQHLQNKLNSFSKENIEQASIQVKYDVYIEKEKELVSRMSQLEDLEIPSTFDYKKILSLGNEAREKLSRIQPRTLGQASRISGINPKRCANTDGIYGKIILNRVANFLESCNSVYIFALMHSHCKFPYNFIFSKKYGILKLRRYLMS